ncbi:hypothetical protein HKBW3S03_00398 [Candidatus Hakubella thermalkaliphila]|uniref:Toxin ParE1/3/4 n=2 Tax=Candidatus Hakubella thermalkaliphila TaxID=2754717 RepID=A0A6V8NFE4_9ACTN|nr:type II toxin-antitoxin system RelE/ParE family toxin [Candidatus Hakubella thermalkaliphila]MBT9170313.1 hypothetical protein [Actinomycetota bacterium]GFP18893.1 hypothetical protein HKBW3S03_00398 [Candidatus Hakubella thermalkaliphila]GFP20856.1 hypothetical protein HKBW3S06_00083 [Candidatus Hakubella thermalkaliphila]GFP39293.1 hypothetical protein HKBW3S47_00992 [Candidatus Hakubella thermalkaliphila]GFP40920.1 hypothetical protein HKBW3C_00045 [Candidatus Hakubella thermalkaliphila]
MARVSWTDEAQKWLREIYEYVSRDNKEAAVKLVNSIHQKVRFWKISRSWGTVY